ncbi:MAG: lamin tail domain-containing protein [Proteobacteria bacterium]|nr:lamin tail domain-containing protein [Pseudomonadota bacterium]
MNKQLLTLLSVSLLLASHVFAETRGSTIIINEFQADPAAGLAGDANGDGVRNSSQDEFIELYNDSGADIVLDGWTLSDSVSVRHTFPVGTTVLDGCAIVVFGGGSPTGVFGDALVQTASTGSVSLNNGGDAITLTDDSATVVVSYIYGSEGNNNQSLTRGPDITGSFADHSSATGSGGALFSPGTLINGSNFSGCAVLPRPPKVQSHNPANNQSGVATNATISIDFDEIINATINAVTISCDANPITFSGLPVNANTTVLLTPDNPLVDEEVCVVTLIASEITDIDDVPDPLDGDGDGVGGDDYVFSFVVGFPLVEIFEIQGDGLTSPLEGIEVITQGNIVTALDTNGFNMQTTDANSDGDPNTSDGIFVYTQNPPTVQVGDEVDVQGPVIEFFELTEIGTPGNLPQITINSSNNPLPTAIEWNSTFPPLDPTVAVCSTDQEDFKYECLEGMFVNMSQGFVSSAFVFFFGANRDDIIIKAGSARAFREPGADHPGVGAAIPIWDTNPELMQVDIDALGLPLLRYSGGTEISLQGVIGHEFNEYEIWPTQITVINENIIPTAVRDTNNNEVTVASINMQRFFNDVDDTGPEDDGQVLTTMEYQDRLTKLSKYFREKLKSPHIVAVQEVERLDVLNDLATKIVDDGGLNYTSVLIEGNDVGGIDVGYMYLGNVTNLSLNQLGAAEIFAFDGSILHDRPPLHLQADVSIGFNELRVNLLNLHLRSRGSITSPTDGERVRKKRMTQGNSVAQMVADIQTASPGEAVIVLGDFNAFQFTDGLADVTGQITGTALEADNLEWTLPLFAADPLTQGVQTLLAEQQYSFVFGGNAQVLDNSILNDPALLVFNQMQFTRGNADASIEFEDDNSTTVRSSDHDGFVLFLTLDLDVIFKDGFE